MKPRGITVPVTVKIVVDAPTRALGASVRAALAGIERETRKADARDVARGWFRVNDPDRPWWSR